MNHPQNPENTWRRQKAKLKLLFSHLNETDFRYDYGMKDVMMTRLQQKLGKSREELNELMTGL
jgi:hypothetical protein